MIELLTPFFPGYFLPLASIANVGTCSTVLYCTLECVTCHLISIFHEHIFQQCLMEQWVVLTDDCINLINLNSNFISSYFILITLFLQVKIFLF